MFQFDYCMYSNLMYSNENNSKNDKIDQYLYLCQEVKAHQFIKLNGKGLNEDIHQGNL